MVTNYPQQIAAASAVTGTEHHGRRSIVARALGSLRQAVCGLHGHDSLLHFEHDRILLRCTSCGHETPGWEIDQRRPRLRFRGDDQGPRYTHSQAVVSRRKIA